MESCKHHPYFSLYRNSSTHLDTRYMKPQNAF